MTTRIRQLEGIEARKDYYQVDPHQIIVQGGWNPRTDFTGEEELQASIIENGVLVPLRVKRGPEDQITLIDGERRLRAALRAIEEGHEISTVPCIFERNGISEPESLFISLVTNQGKPLDPTEEADAFRRLTAWGLSTTEIAKRIGKSSEFVRQRLTLVDAAPELKAAVQSDQVSLKSAVKIVKESNGDTDTQTAKLQTAPKKNERRPIRTPSDRILDMADKLTRGQIIDLIGRLNLMVEELKREEDQLKQSLDQTSEGNRSAHV